MECESEEIKSIQQSIDVDNLSLWQLMLHVATPSCYREFVHARQLLHTTTMKSSLHPLQQCQVHLFEKAAGFASGGRKWLRMRLLDLCNVISWTMKSRTQMMTIWKASQRLYWIWISMTSFFFDERRVESMASALTVEGYVDVADTFVKIDISRAVEEVWRDAQNEIALLLEGFKKTLV